MAAAAGLEHLAVTTLPKIWRSAYSGHVGDVQRLLAENPADIERIGKWNSTPLTAAAGRGHEAVVALLLAHGALVSVTNDRGMSPLHAAVGGGHLAATRLLLNAGADPTATDCVGLHPLHYAAQNGHAEVVELLLASGAFVSCKDNDSLSFNTRALGCGPSPPRGKRRAVCHEPASRHSTPWSCEGRPPRPFRSDEHTS